MGIVAFSGVWRDLRSGFSCVGSSCESLVIGWKLVVVVKLDEDLQSHDEVVLQYFKFIWLHFSGS